MDYDFAMDFAFLTKSIIFDIYTDHRYRRNTEIFLLVFLIVSLCDNQRIQNSYSYYYDSGINKTAE